MIHAHKELLIFSEENQTRARWHHMDSVRLEIPYEEDLLLLMEEMRSDPLLSVVCSWPKPSVVTEIDYLFFGETIRERISLTNKALARFRIRWNDTLPRTFDSVFGSWPWDHLDVFHDPVEYAKLRTEYGIKDARIFMWVV